MKYIWVYFLCTALIACKQNTSTNQIDIEEGVPLELATSRKEQISNVKYNLSFHIPSDLNDSIKSNLILELSIQDANKPLILDFKSNRTTPKTSIVNGESTAIQYKNEHLIIPSDHLIEGKNKIEIAFTAGEMSLNRNEDYLFTLLVPDRARTLFPCFDQPDLKANYIVDITAPTDWQVLAGAPLAKKTEKGDFNEFQFKESDKMSTYLFSFVAGVFQVEKAPYSDISSTLYHQEKDRGKIELSTPEIFNIHKQSVDYLNHYTNYNFPFQKLDYAAIYTHPYGGMEHTGAIQYRQSILFLDHSATINQKLRRAKLIAHETSHMWFGNLVTMKWFNDVWLKEVFANFMADKIVNPQFPDVNHDLSFFVDHYPYAYAVDRSTGANPISQQLDNLKDAGSLYGNIIYDKAPIMMRQLETMMGEENFQRDIQEYIAKYADDNADWNDLITILDKNTEIDLKAWSNTWVNSPGRPIIKSKIQFNESNQIESFLIEQTPEYPSENSWPQIFDIALIYEDSTHIIEVDLKGQQIELAATHRLDKPDAIIYNSNGLGYGVFPTSVEELEIVNDTKDEVSRAQIYLNCHENVLRGDISIKQAIKTYLRGVKSENNELILSMLCNQLNHLFWNYLSEQERNEEQNKIADLLLTRLQSNDTPDIKKTLFRSFKNIAYQGNSLDLLYKIWNEELTIANLSLNQEDYTSLAMQLALYGHQSAPEILEKSRAAIQDANKLERFDFLIPALSSDPKTRKDYFQSFQHKQSREKENWVVSACYYIHHPLRQGDAIEYLGLSLSLLEEIQQTGDIFFPKKWLNNTVGMYSSPEAYKTVTSFLSQNPELNPQLRLKVLQSTDDLNRVNQ